VSYHDARRCFQENLELIGTPPAGEDVFMYNLNNGLDALAQAVHSDMQQIKSLLDQILQQRR
jgi:hypothetical protein